jgi:hypothetical protein
MLHEWERLGGELHAEFAGGETSVNAFNVARAMGFDVVPGLRASRSQRIEGLIIWVDETQHHRHQHAAVAIELAGWAIRSRDLPVTAEAREQVAAALLLPRAHVLEELESGADPRALHRHHTHVPYALVALRCAQLADVVASVWSSGRVVHRFGPAYTRAAGSPTAAERALAARARGHVGLVGGVGAVAFPVHEPGADVVTLAHGVPFVAAALRRPNNTTGRIAQLHA